MHFNVTSIMRFICHYFYYLNYYSFFLCLFFKDLIVFSYRGYEQNNKTVKIVKVLVQVIVLPSIAPLFELTIANGGNN